MWYNIGKIFYKEAHSFAVLAHSALYRFVFSPRRAYHDACLLLRIFWTSRKPCTEEFPIPHGEIYEIHRKQMTDWIRDARAYPYREVSITSHDGLVLRGRYFEQEKGAPIELLLHGYRGWAERDLSGGVFRCFGIGHNVLIVDHRGCGESEGHVTTFGAKESLDCLAWIDFILREIDPTARIILSGVSMGAATVMTGSTLLSRNSEMT